MALEGLRNHYYEDGHKELKLQSLEKRRLRNDLVVTHAYRLLQGPSRLRRRSGAFSVRVVKYWNRLPAHLVLAPSVSIFKKQLDRHWFEIFPAAPV